MASVIAASFGRATQRRKRFSFACVRKSRKITDGYDITYTLRVFRAGVEDAVSQLRLTTPLAPKKSPKACTRRRTTENTEEVGFGNRAIPVE
jgi:hypothetical protein